MDGLFDGAMAVSEQPYEPAADEETTKRPVRAPRPRGFKVRSKAGRLGRRSVLAAIVLALVAFPGYVLYAKLTQPPAAERAAASVEKGLAEHRAGRLDAAAAKYREALSLDPLNKFAHYNLGLLAQTSGDNATAEREYRLALAIDPRLTTALFNLAIVRAGAGSLSEAAELYRQVIAIEPNNAAAHLNLGFAYERLGMRDKAQAEFGIAIRLDPSLAQRIPTTAS